MIIYLHYYLFLRLTHALRRWKGKRNGISIGSYPYNFAGRMLNLQYANDTLLFVNTDFSIIRTSNICFYALELVLEFKINFN